MYETSAMTEQIREQLSAFLDGELADSESGLFLKRLLRDDELQRTLSRYVVLGEAMRSPVAAGASRDFPARVAAALDAERPVMSGGAGRLRAGARAWVRTAAGIAVAAGVAAVAIVSLRVDTGTSQRPALAVIEVSRPVLETVEPSSYVVPQPVRTLPIVPAARLTNYVFAHSEYSSPLGRRNVLSGILADDQALQAPDAETWEASVGSR